MAVAATIKYFGTNPTVIVMQSSTQFDGSTAQSSLPTITPGLYTFPAQAGGGLFNLHEYAIRVLDVSYAGGGTLTVSKVIGSAVIPLGTVSGAGSLAMEELIQLAPGEYLKFVSSGATNPTLAITSQEFRAPLGMVG